MKNILKYSITAILLILVFSSVYAHDDHDHDGDFVNQFSESTTITEVDCTLENGDSSTCYQIETIAIPETFEIGPFCPETLDDEDGIWEWDGENPGVYLLNRAFFEMVAEQGYVFYDDEGNINIGIDELPPAPGDIGDTHSCIIHTAHEEVTMTVLIPVEPVLADTPTNLGNVAQVGIGIDGVPVFADAPTFTTTGNLPALDECGGHMDPGGWYHWHATASDIDSSFEYEGAEELHCHLEQSASALFAYAYDGYPIYGSAEPDGSLPEDLDDCNGHFGATPENPEGEYHYHSTLDFPNLPHCLVGVVASNNFVTTADSGIGSEAQSGQGQGGRPEGGPPGDGEGRPEGGPPGNGEGGQGGND
ncbi:MAG: YHYH protein [Aggregatilineales bacterium]